MGCPSFARLKKEEVYKTMFEDLGSAGLWTVKKTEVEALMLELAPRCVYTFQFLLIKSLFILSL